ncbi:hypothetical protein GUITHDRAFT_68111, partial [Guillardia theta CCMP2712]
LDVDTVLTAESYDAAVNAAGCVIEAIKDVMEGKGRNAFCVVRPAGHHAGPQGASEAMVEQGSKTRSHGFCLLSNVAIGAAHAMANRLAARVAIVDFDVHHGNGTEEVIRNLKPWRYKHVADTPLGEVAFDTLAEGPWLTERDSENVFFCSIHGFGEYSTGSPYTGLFYPGLGGATEEPNILNIPLGPKFGTQDFRREKLLPRLHSFKPDLVLVSAGFDGHEADFMNYGLVSLTEDDFFWVTDKLCEVAEVTCGGKLVSILEGGYNTNGGPLSPLARRFICFSPPLLCLSSSTLDLLSPPHASPACPRTCELC